MCFIFRVLVFFVLFNSVAFAAATVVDIRNRDRGYGAQPAQPRPVADAETPGNPVQPIAQPTSFSQIQALQDEVRELRGLLEEQANEIRQLKKRQLDDYRNIDGRLTGLNDRLGALAAPAAAGANQSGAITGVDGNVDGNADGNMDGNTPPRPGADIGADEQPPNDTSIDPQSQGSAAVAPGARSLPPVGASPDSDTQQYDAAYDLLKQRKVDLAEKGFRAYIAAHPGGPRVANAHYWLGEIALLQNRLEPARVAFATVVEKYPQDRKAEDATFKLGKVYHLQGDNARAKALLTKVAVGDSGAARLAQSYLRDNF